MTPTEKAARAVSTLTRQTIEGAINWEKCEPALTPANNANDRIDDYYETAVFGRLVAIYTGRTPHWDENEQCWWEDYVEIAVLGPDRHVEWRFPRVAGTEELLEAVRYRSAGMDTFLDGLIGPGGDKP